MIRSHRDGIPGTAWQTATPAAQRACPYCQAGPNQPCRRWVPGHARHTDEETGIRGGYWKRVNSFHSERSGRQPKKPRIRPFPPEAFHSGH